MSFVPFPTLFVGLVLAKVLLDLLEALEVVLDEISADTESHQLVDENEQDLQLLTCWEKYSLTYECNI